ncbi:MAG: cysteine desulfurase [Caldilineaceae bacterium SB0662_bin_9]|uniref:Cysteine desulfurase n=1 Tax=Caldilineaceae bacterium SB0662_bin_9 TaxID=2605258 RepID=A0A6B1DX80_9CHLR|nr:cysteine desulfurase [Caldilineaceae bacterium SB0662_bin_9]
MDWAAVRSQFPIMERKVQGGIPLVYLDNAASSQKPAAVLEAMARYYRTSHANVHRGVHTLSEEATALYEDARQNAGRLINAPSSRECVYVRNTTEGINLVAGSWGRANLGPGDTVVTTVMEHHSNIVPWQILQAERGFDLRYVPVTPEGNLDRDVFGSLMAEEPKLVCFTHVSNVLGTVNPVAELTAEAHAAGALVLVDGAQGVPHLPVDVQALGVDFYVYSGHKMCGPTGIGLLWARRELLQAMPPWMGGGEMIREVTLEGSRWNELPYKFEAGTPAIAEAVGLGAAAKYLMELGMDNVARHGAYLTNYAYNQLVEIEGVHILGPGPEERMGLVSFHVDEVHPHDLAAILDLDGVAIRAGHHCAQPLHRSLDLIASARASFYLYNTESEIDRLAAGIERARRIF